MSVSMVMVMDRNRLIGSGGGMPWHIPSELQYFKSVTMGKPIVMGRKTYESIGRALPGRTNIVVTSQADYSAENILIASSLDVALALAAEHVSEENEIMIIGGSSLCRLAMPLTDKLYLTIIDEEFEGDTWLDSYQSEEWQEISCDKREADGYSLTYLVLTRKLES